MFDPYRKWLGIPEDQRPPTHYQLLGISPDEKDLDVIEAAMLRQSSFVRNFQTGAHAEDASRVLTEIAAARLCLVDAGKRAKYDAELRRKNAPPRPSHSSARHSDLAIDVTPPAAASPARPAARPANVPPRVRDSAVDLDRLLPPAPRRPLREPRLSAGAALGRRRTSSGPVGYVWQVPLVAAVLIALSIFARTLGHTIAAQRAPRELPAPAVAPEE